jgi:hypothetical protein
MQLNSYFVKSRHGIYYLRVQRCGVDKRVSLRTRDPEKTRVSAYKFGVFMANNEFGFDFVKLHLNLTITTSSSSVISAGLPLTWGTGRTGEVFNLLTESELMNPIVMLYEVDKAVGNYTTPIEPILLSLFETESARSFKKVV